MDRGVTPSRGDFYTSDPQSTALLSPDPEARGRKRRRDPLNPFSLPRHKPSAESSTLRGRCRHRSPSRMHLVSAASSTAASHTTSRRRRTGRHSRSPAPERRRLAGAVGGGGVVVVVMLRPENHRRSQSPSRSRSPGGSEIEAEAVPVGMAQRRRQRTQSRSRRHGLPGALTSVAQAGRPNLGLEGWVAEDGARAKD